MTATELRNEFDIAFDFVMSHNAPSLDDYEVSVFLTNAQSQFVKTLAPQFEKNEDVRSKLRPLIKTEALTVESNPTKKMGDYSEIFKEPTDLLYIVKEFVKFPNTNVECYTGRIISVKPTSNDDIYDSLHNPFRKPGDQEMLRVDADKVFELHMSKEVYEDATLKSDLTYYMTYIKTPNPLIIGDLGTLSIEGQSSVITSTELSDATLKDIVIMAAELARAVYQNPKNTN